MDNIKSMNEPGSYLRLALPLMSKHCVPVTPTNYALWYDYVSGENKELRKTLDSMIEKEEEFSEEQNEMLSRRFCLRKDESALAELREGLRQILVTIFSEVIDLHGQAERYESFVSNSVDKLSEDTSIQKIKNIVGEIIIETKAMGKFGKSIQKSLKKATEELETLQKESEQAKIEASVDFLTGLANRKAFNETLAAFTSKATSHDDHLCLLLIDIDHFKKFNDEHGHIVGDEVLKFVARKIKEAVKGRDFTARYGGEEFAVILPQTPLSGAKTVAENIRVSFALKKLKQIATSKELGTLTVSIGAAHYRPSESLDEFIHRSDQALYFAKNAGRNRVATESDLVYQGE